MTQAKLSIDMLLFVEQTLISIQSQVWLLTQTTSIEATAKCQHFLKPIKSLIQAATVVRDTYSPLPRWQINFIPLLRCCKNKKNLSIANDPLF